MSFELEFISRCMLFFCVTIYVKSLQLISISFVWLYVESIQLRDRQEKLCCELLFAYHTYIGQQFDKVIKACLLSRTFVMILLWFMFSDHFSGCRFHSMWQQRWHQSRGPPSLFHQQMDMPEQLCVTQALSPVARHTGPTPSSGLWPTPCQSPVLMPGA